MSFITQIRDSKAAKWADSKVAMVTGLAIAAAGSANAAAVTVDTSTVTDQITTAIGTITSLGVSCLSLYVIVKMFIWIRGAVR